MPLQRPFVSLTVRNDMLYSSMIDATTPNLISFYLATTKHMGGSDSQLQAVWRAHEPYQTPLGVDIETDDLLWNFGRVDLVDDFRTYYGRCLIAPGFSLQDNLVNELLCHRSHDAQSVPPLWMGLFSLYGMPLVHLGDSLEAQSAVYAKQALSLAAANYDHSLAAIFGDIICESARRQEATAAALSSSYASLGLHRTPPLPMSTPPPSNLDDCARRSPLDILESLAFDGRLSNLPLSLPGYYDHGLYDNRHWSSVPQIRDIVLDCVWQWDFLSELSELPQWDTPIQGALHALEQLGRTAVVLACGTHKPGDEDADNIEFDFYLCFLVTLVYSLRAVLVSLQHRSAVQNHAADLVRCLWAMFVLVYILQLRPKMDISLLDANEHRSGMSHQFREFRADQQLAAAKHQDAFYLRALRSMVGLATCETDRGWQILINSAATKFRRNWQRWLGLQPGEGATLNIRL